MGIGATYSTKILDAKKGGFILITIVSLITPIGTIIGLFLDDSSDLAPALSCLSLSECSFMSLSK